LEIGGTGDLRRELTVADAEKSSNQQTLFEWWGYSLMMWVLGLLYKELNATGFR